MASEFLCARKLSCLGLFALAGALIPSAFGAESGLVVERIKVTQPVVPLLYRGDGGKFITINGIEIWTIGRPDRAYQDVTTLGAELSHFDPDKTYEFTTLEVSVAKIAGQSHADAAIPDGFKADGKRKATIYYRIVKYVDEQKVAARELLHDDSVIDATGTIAPNYSIKQPIVRYLPDSRNIAVNSGRAVVRICVDPRGEPNPPPVIARSSGYRDVDYAAVEYEAQMSFVPASVYGKPVTRCSYLPYTKH